MTEEEAKKLEDEFHLATGRAITAWSGVEAALCGAYTVQAFPNNNRLGMHSFWSVSSFDGKLKLCDAVLQHALKGDEEFLREWNSIKNSLQRQSKNRNKVAHGITVRGAWTENGAPVRGVRFYPFYMANLTKTGFGETGECEQLTLAQINDMTETFHRAFRRLISFASGMIHHE